MQALAQQARPLAARAATANVARRSAVVVRAVQQAPRCVERSGAMCDARIGARRAPAAPHTPYLEPHPGARHRLAAAPGAARARLDPATTVRAHRRGTGTRRARRGARASSCALPARPRWPSLGSPRALCDAQLTHIYQPPHRRPTLPAALKPASLTVLANALLAAGAHADAGKIFDFNLTMPIMAGQFLLLMVFLDKAWFTPVGALLDSRDGELRGKLALVKDSGSGVRELQEQGEKVLAEARSAAQKQVADAKAAVTGEAAKELAAAKAKVDAALKSAMAALEGEKEAALKGLDAQVAALSAQILARVLPEGVKV